MLRWLFSWLSRRRQRRLEEDQAHVRARALLQECLSPQQWAEYVARNSFIVRGNVTGRPYRIHHGTTMNVEPLNQDGTTTGRRLCFFPVGGLPLHDVLVGQMYALQGMEDQALRLANSQLEMYLRH